MSFDTTGIRLIAFDADDTLWDNQSLFDKAVESYCRLLSCYGGEKAVFDSLYERECANMPSLGYGTKAFIISLVENAIKVSGGTVSNETLNRVVKIGREILDNPATPLPGVYETLKAIKNKGLYRTVLFTKGDPLEQENKLERSALGEFFDDVEIASNKTPVEYRRLCAHNNVPCSEFLMVGNSFKSDIAPVLEIGGKAVLISFNQLWQHEVVEEYDHPNLLRLKEFSNLLDIL